MGGWRGGAWRLPLVVVALLTWLAGCGGDAAITGPPGFVAGYPRIERVGALTFVVAIRLDVPGACLLYTSPSPRDKRQSRMPSSA